MPKRTNILRVLLGLLFVQAWACAATPAARAIAYQPCESAPCTAALNFAWDAEGDPDTRPNTWGTAASVSTPVHFLGVPAGYRVRVRRVYGDLIAWAHGNVPAGKNAGVLWGLLNTSSGGSQELQYASDGCFIYLQGSVNAANLRAPFDQDVSAGGLLGEDNTFLNKMAVWLNDTGLSIHIEATMVVVYSYEKEPIR